MDWPGRGWEWALVVGVHPFWEQKRPGCSCYLEASPDIWLLLKHPFNGSRWSCAGMFFPSIKDVFYSWCNQSKPCKTWLKSLNSWISMSNVCYILRHYCFFFFFSVFKACLLIWQNALVCWQMRWNDLYCPLPSLLYQPCSVESVTTPCFPAWAQHSTPCKENVAFISFTLSWYQLVFCVTSHWYFETLAPCDWIKIWC